MYSCKGVVKVSVLKSGLFLLYNIKTWIFSVSNRSRKFLIYLKAGAPKRVSTKKAQERDEERTPLNRRTTTEARKRKSSVKERKKGPCGVWNSRRKFAENSKKGNGQKRWRQKCLIRFADHLSWLQALKPCSLTARRDNRQAQVLPLDMIFLEQRHAVFIYNRIVIIVLVSVTYVTHAYLLEDECWRRFHET